MKLIIDIPEQTYKNIIMMCMFGSEEMSATIEAILNSKPLQAEFEEIKAEIEQDAFKDVNGSKYIFVNRVNQIIDKYKAEREELKGENK